MADAREIIEAEVNKGMLLASSGEIAFEIIDALSAAGFAIVPREATEEMISIGANCHGCWHGFITGGKITPDVEVRT